MKAYIFDLDGTLLDSMGLWEQIDIEFLTKRGFEVPPDYINEICSRNFREAAEYTIERFDISDSVEDLIAEWNAMAVYAYGNTIKMKPYAREYLTALKEKGVKLGIATSLPPVLYYPALHSNEIERLFDAVCSTDGMPYGKTKPDIFLLTAKMLGVEPADCVVYEDIMQAIKSAKQAGMTVYGVLDQSSQEYWEEIQAIADGVLYDFKEAPLPK